MLIEDDENLQMLIGRVLQKFGFEGEVVGSGEQALAVLDQRLVEVVVSDVFLPGISGKELIHAIKSKQPKTEIILISGMPPDQVDDPIDPQLYRTWLIKPFSLSTLIAEILKALEK